MSLMSSDKSQRVSANCVGVHAYNIHFGRGNETCTGYIPPQEVFQEVFQERVLGGCQANHLAPWESQCWVNLSQRTLPNIPPQVLA